MLLQFEMLCRLWFCWHAFAAAGSAAVIVCVLALSVACAKWWGIDPRLSTEEMFSFGRLTSSIAPCYWIWVSTPRPGHGLRLLWRCLVLQVDVGDTNCAPSAFTIILL